MPAPHARLVLTARVRHRATGLIHTGQAVTGCGGTVDCLVRAVFNHPALAESVKAAALAAAGKARAIIRLSG